MVDDPYCNPMGDDARRADYEYQLALDCILPFLNRWGIGIRGLKILDVGCGSGGLSIALAEQGACCVGIDHNAQRIAMATAMAARHHVDPHFLEADILKLNNWDERFDVILLSEVVEHLVALPNVTTLLSWCRGHLTVDGRIYVSFPPWLNPFGGHQAGWPGICYIPWYHLLPKKIKQWLVPQQATQYLDFAQELDHLTLQAFEKAVNQAKLKIIRRELFHLRPEYYWRYRVPTIRSFPLVAHIPLIREMLITGAFYLLA